MFDEKWKDDKYGGVEGWWGLFTREFVSQCFCRCLYLLTRVSGKSSRTSRFPIASPPELRDTLWFNTLIFYTFAIGTITTFLRDLNLLLVVLPSSCNGRCPIFWTFSFSIHLMDTQALFPTHSRHFHITHFAHSLSLLVCTPDCTLSRIFNGLSSLPEREQSSCKKRSSR